MQQKRNSGLDFFRTLAILLVLISHTRHLFSYLHLNYFNIWYLSIGGYLGVELFFVLSGFLIGDQLYKYVVNSKNKKYNLKVFYLRRWFRTLPLYYLFLIIYILFYYFYFHKNYFPILHIFFLQNFDRQAIKFFAVSWSLSVEEWFYLLIPFILLLSAHFYSKKFLPLILIFVLIGIIKAYVVYKYPELTWTDIRKNIFLRFDSLLVGVFFAYLKNYKQQIFVLFKLKRYFCLGFLGILMLSIWYWYKLQPGLDRDFFSKAFMFQLTSIFLAFIMIYLYFNFNFKSKIWYYGAIYSYSIYLMHFLFLLPFIKIAHCYKSVFVSFILLIIFYLLNIFFAALIYKYFEKPILNKRPSYLI
jgi:peptidoglycan/LPS O-acetylase OafA/YrhL